jgi:hypothetical protein
MKSIIIFLAFFVAINATAQTNDTAKICTTDKIIINF